MPKITAKQVSATIEYLTAMGLLKKSGKNKFEQTNKTVSTGKMDAVKANGSVKLLLKME